jgi:hypothetical protein
VLKFAESSNGTFKATIFRSGYFFPSPKYPADVKHQRGSGEKIVDTIFGPVLSALGPYGYTPVTNLAVFAVEAIKGRWDPKVMWRNPEFYKAIKESGINGDHI